MGGLKKTYDRSMFWGLLVLRGGYQSIPLGLGLGLFLFTDTVPKRSLGSASARDDPSHPTLIFWVGSRL